MVFALFLVECTLHSMPAIDAHGVEVGSAMPQARTHTQ